MYNNFKSTLKMLGVASLVCLLLTSCEKEEPLQTNYYVPDPPAGVDPIFYTPSNQRKPSRTTPSFKGSFRTSPCHYQEGTIFACPCPDYIDPPDASIHCVRCWHLKTFHK